MTVPAATEVERTRRLYRVVAPLYDAFRRLWSRWTRPAEEALDALFRERIGAETRILELAPGTGINVERLLRCAPDFAAYLGIDSSTEMLARAREKARGDSRIELRIGDATDLRAVDGSFEFLVCTWLLSHLDAPAETARDALAKLSTGGTAAFVFFTRPRKALLRRVLAWLGGPLRYRFVDAEAIRALPNLERLESCAAGMATLAVFRVPGAPLGTSRRRNAPSMGAGASSVRLHPPRPHAPPVARPLLPPPPALGADRSADRPRESGRDRTQGSGRPNRGTAEGAPPRGIERRKTMDRGAGGSLGRRWRVRGIVLLTAAALGGGLAASVAGAEAGVEGPEASKLRFHDVRQQTREFHAYNRSIVLDAEQRRVMQEALGRLPAPCCADKSAATCCCACNMARSWWGLSKHLIAHRGYDADQVREAVVDWFQFINPDGFTGNSCYAGGCNRPFHANGCGGMDERRIRF